MDAQGISVYRSQNDPSLILMTIRGRLCYDNLRLVVETTLLPMIEQSLDRPVLLVHHVNVEICDTGVMSAVFKITELLRSRVEWCAIVKAPPIVCEAIQMVMRVDTDIRNAVFFTNTLPEALLMIEALRSPHTN